MRYNRVGNSGLKVSQLCLGTNNFGTQLDEQATAKVIERSLELGVNILDTANVYAKQKSEEFIGRIVKGRRDEVVLATKVSSKMGEGPNMAGLSRKHVMWQVGESLRRLQTSYIDLYYAHNFDPETPLEESLATFDQLVKSGLVRYVAVSNFTAEQLRETIAICEDKDLEKPIALQPPYNLLDRGIEQEIVPYCEDEKIGILSYSPLAGGFLTGKYARDDAPPQGSRAAMISWYGDSLKRRDFDALERFRAIAKDSGYSMRQLALAWIVAHPQITSAIVGASRPEQVDENSQALELKVPGSLMEKLDGLSQP